MRLTTSLFLNNYIMQKSLLITTLLIALSVVGFAQQLAFPGAEGFGKYATGGRTGSVYHVTNLNDSGTGSLRDAVSQPNRIVVFDVAGVIRINSTLAVKPNIYLAGQTAPGEGITVYGDRTTFSSADNTICRYMRFRMGAVGSSGKDAMGIANGKDMIFDHVSVSWGRDETFSINWDGKGTEPTNITIQNSIISQGLLLHSAGGLIQTGGGVTLYRNLYVDNSTRNNKVKGVNQYVNNIVYNWKNAAYIMGGDSDGSSYVNVTNNYFIKGPDNGGTPISDGNSDFHIYADDNWYDNNLDGEFNGYEIPFSEYSGGPDFQDAPYAYPTVPTWSATALVDSLLPIVGASLPYSDLADYYVISEVKSFGKKGELISNESTLPIGTPTSWSLWTGNTRTDSDHDGMPDAWEDANGTNKAANDAMTISSNGYANIENYINSIDKSYSQAYLRTPLNLEVSTATTNTVTLSWLDYTRDEDGFIIERNINGTFTEIGRVEKDVDSYTITGLAPEEQVIIRVSAYNADITSNYANITAKSRPVEVPVLNLTTYTPDKTWTGSVDGKWDNATQNWENGTTAAAYADADSVLFGDLDAGNQAVDITADVAPATVVVNSAYDYRLAGTGAITGETSLNKAGTGTLKLGSENTYTGPTVIWDGVVDAGKLANGGLPSSIGASANYGFNLVLKGGVLNYTGSSVTIDRNIVLGDAGNLSIFSSASTLTMTGTISGIGSFTKSGNGTLRFKNKIGNDYEGHTILAGGLLQIDMNGATDIIDVIGTSNAVELAGGTLETTNGQSSNYEEYNFHVIVPEGTTGGFKPYRNCYFKSKVSGTGTLNYTIPYVREYVQGDWSEFSGVLNAIGGGSDSNGSQLMLNNSVGLPNTRLNLSGNTKVINWATSGTMRLGGLSGNSGTFLGCASKATDGTTMNWIVGGAGTDETFNGIINNDCSANGHYGVTSIIKEGTGIWRLNSANIYAGATTVNDGKLIINGYQTGNGAVTVNAGGTLAGKGRVLGVTYVKADAVIEPGDNAIATFRTGRLVLYDGSQSNFEINKTANTYDKISSTGTVTYNGKLNLNITGTLVAGDQFTLFTGTSHIGEFDEISPAIPAEGLVWKFENGILKVAYPSSVNEIKEVGYFAYPNPFNNDVTLNLPEEMAQKSVVKIISAGGAIVFQQPIENQANTLTIDVQNLPKGLYYCTISNGKKQLVQKLSK